MKTKEILANQIYGEDANEVLKFLANVAPNKTTFRNEQSFLNFVAKKLEPILKKKAQYCEKTSTQLKNLLADMDLSVENVFSIEELQEKIKKIDQNATFWNNRAISMDINNQTNKSKNVLWCIKLLNGKCAI